MKRMLIALIASGVTVPALGTDASASIGISQPGLYGQINIGDLPRPAVIYAQSAYFVREDWYQARYVPRYAKQEQYARGESDGHGLKHGQGTGKGHDGGDR